MMNFQKILLAFLFLGFCQFGISQIDLPTDFIDELLNIDIERPVGIEFSDDGFAFIHQKVGRVFCVDSAGVQFENPVIDISEEVTAYGDHGLVGFALDPDFTENGYIYLYYVVDRHYLDFFGTNQYDPNTTIENQASIGRIARYQLDVNNTYKTLIPNSRKILLGHDYSDGIPILMISHGVGSLVFGQDGTLLVSVGDGGSFTVKDQGNAVDTYHEQSMSDGTLEVHQNVGSYRSMLKNSLNGRVLRIDPETGAGISSNPFYDINDPNSDASKTWVSGFRNPYKFVHVNNTGSHDPALGDPGLFILGDVGAGSWEELNYIRESGKWYGWPMYEGFHGSWQFQGYDVKNKEATNPLFGIDGCDQEYFYFKEMYADAHAFNVPIFYNSCNTNIEIPQEYLKYVHERPKLAYNNNLWNPPTRTEVGIFKTDGSPKSVHVTDSASGMEESDPVEGGSSIPGDINVYVNFPESYQNHLFLVDYHGFISTLKLDENYDPVNIKKFVDLPKGITDCAFSPIDGRLYYINHLESEVRRIEYGGILPPTIHLEVDKEYGAGPLSVHFDASKSISNSGTDLTFEWDFGDGQSANESIVDHKFDGSDVRWFNVELIVTDSIGLQSIKTQVISINNTPPRPKITSIKDGSTYSVDDYTVALLQAEVEDDEQSEQGLEYVWRADFHHDEHYHPGPPIEKKEAYLIFDPLGCEDEVYWYQIYLEVTDAGGLKGIDSVFVSPYCGPDFVEFIALEGSMEESKVFLNWATSFEDSLTHFEIERAPDHIFQKIGQVTAGNSSYEFIDEAPYVGYNFYRVRAVHKDGHYSFSNTIRIEIEEENKFKVYPNPSNGQFNLQHYSGSKSTIRIEVYSIGGQFVEALEVEDKAILFEEAQIDLSHLGQGVYVLKISNEKYSETLRILVF